MLVGMIGDRRVVEKKLSMFEKITTDWGSALYRRIVPVRYYAIVELQLEYPWNKNSSWIWVTKYIFSASDWESLSELERREYIYK